MKKSPHPKKTEKKEAGVYLFQNKFFLAGVLIVLLSFIIYKIWGRDSLDNLKNKVIPDAVKKVVNNPNAKIKIENVSMKSGVVQFDLKLDVGMGEQKYVSYITKDGKILFTSGIELDKFNATQTSSRASNRKAKCEDLEKSRAPLLTAYVMANCPFGLQMQRVFKMMMNTNPAVFDNLRVEYIFNQDSNFETGDLNALHGKEEAQENLRQICIREEQKNFYWPYVSCYMKKQNNSENCLSEVGVDTASLDACMKDKNRGLKYAKQDFDNTQKLGISGSPTLVLNGKQLVDEFGFGGRNPNAIKEILCCSADKKLAYCGLEFSKTDAATSFSESDLQSNTGSNTASAANCN